MQIVNLLISPFDITMSLYPLGSLIVLLLLCGYFQLVNRAYLSAIRLRPRKRLYTILYPLQAGKHIAATLYTIPANL